MKSHLYTFCLFILALPGCTALSRPLYAPPSTHYPPAIEKIQAPAILEDLKVQCLKNDGDNNYAPASMTQSSQLAGNTGALQQSVTTSATSNAQTCTYLSVDVSDAVGSIKSVNQAQLLIGYLTTISNMNCTNYLQRVFTLKTYADSSKSLLNDLVTGGAAGSAHAVPGLSASLSVTNIIVGHTVDEVDKALFMGGTYQALEIAIITKRNEIKTLINGKIAKAITASTKSWDDEIKLAQSAVSDAKAKKNAANTDLNDPNKGPDVASKTKALEIASLELATAEAKEKEVVARASAAKADSPVPKFATSDDQLMAAQMLLLEVLPDVRAYDDACSIKAGLTQLIKVASETRNDAEKKLKQSELGNNSKRVELANP